MFFGKFGKQDKKRDKIDPDRQKRGEYYKLLPDSGQSDNIPIGAGTYMS